MLYPHTHTEKEKQARCYIHTRTHTYTWSVASCGWKDCMEHSLNPPNPPYKKQGLRSRSILVFSVGFSNSDRTLPRLSLLSLSKEEQRRYVIRLKKELRTRYREAILPSNLLRCFTALFLINFPWQMREVCMAPDSRLKVNTSGMPQFGRETGQGSGEPENQWHTRRYACYPHVSPHVIKHDIDLHCGTTLPILQLLWFKDFK